MKVSWRSHLGTVGWFSARYMRGSNGHVLKVNNVRVQRLQFGRLPAGWPVGLLVAALSTIFALAAGTSDFNIKFGGDLTGDGTATNSGTAVTITGSVTDAKGNKGDLFVTLKPVSSTDTRHYTGTGTALGMSIVVTARLDSAGKNEAALKTQRITATFTLGSDGHGRIVGHIPVPEGTLPPAKTGNPGGGTTPGPGTSPPTGPGNTGDSGGGGPPPPPPSHRHGDD